MPRFDANTATCRVLTFKEGLLSAVAHDLLLRVGTFSITFDESAGTVDASFDPASLRVVCAMRDGVQAPEVLSDGDKRKIEAHLRDDILQVRRHTELHFTAKRSAGDAQSVELDGELRLHGQSNALRVHAERKADTWLCDVALHQPDWGIQPFRAMLGTLRVKPTVHVQLEVPAG